MFFDNILNTLYNLGFPKELVVVAIATLPIAELRVAIPFAMGMIPSVVYPQSLPWHNALPLAIAGNLIPVPFLLLFFGAISRRLSKIGIFERWLNWLDELARRRGKIVGRYKRIGLVLLVAIPLPVTGAWTASLVATILNIKFKHAFLSILAGVCIAGAIVISICILAGKGL